jgi:histidinol-phosphate aminotransferase
VATVAELAAACPKALVIVDEAYIEFGGENTFPLVASHPNVAVVRTFSKAFALAGARVGYCLAAPEVVDDLRRVRLPYHLSAITQAAGLCALHHTHEAGAILEMIRQERDLILRRLGEMSGVEAFPSEANFVLFRPAGDAKTIWRALLDRGVLVRDMTGVVEGALRVTAGTPHEVELFVTSLQEVLAV